MAFDAEEFGLASSYNMYALDTLRHGLVVPGRSEKAFGNMQTQEDAFIAATEAQIAANLEGLQTTPFAALGLTALAEKR